VYSAGRNSNVKKSLKRDRKRLLDKLIYLPVKLSSNKGPIVRDTLSRKINSKKDKKRKGRVRGRIVHPKMKWSKIIEEGLEPEEYWDDWRDCRDSMRNWHQDNTLYKSKIVGWKHDYHPEEINSKLDKALAIRKARKKNNSQCG